MYKPAYCYLLDFLMYLLLSSLIRIAYLVLPRRVQNIAHTLRILAAENIDRERVLLVIAYRDANAGSIGDNALRLQRHTGDDRPFHFR